MLVVGRGKDVILGNSRDGWLISAPLFLVENFFYWGCKGYFGKKMREIEVCDNINEICDYRDALSVCRFRILWCILDFLKKIIVVLFKLIRYHALAQRSTDCITKTKCAIIIHGIFNYFFYSILFERKFLVFRYHALAQRSNLDKDRFSPSSKI